MPSRKKIDLQKVLTSLNTTCPKCGRVIEQEIVHLNFGPMVCQECGYVFQAREMRVVLEEKRRRLTELRNEFAKEQKVVHDRVERIRESIRREADIQALGYLVAGATALTIWETIRHVYQFLWTR